MLGHILFHVSLIEWKIKIKKRKGTIEGGGEKMIYLLIVIKYKLLVKIQQ